MKQTYMELKMAFDKLLDEACKEIKNNEKIAKYANEVSEIAKAIAERVQK